jgi:hypothetical protein
LYKGTSCLIQNDFSQHLFFWEWVKYFKSTLRRQLAAFILVEIGLRSVWATPLFVANNTPIVYRTWKTIHRSA